VNEFAHMSDEAMALWSLGNTVERLRRDAEKQRDHGAFEDVHDREGHVLDQVQDQPSDVGAQADLGNDQRTFPPEPADARGVEVVLGLFEGGAMQKAH
jgi:hypothetical protein